MMWGKITFLLIAYIAVLAGDIAHLRKNERPERLVYWALMLISIYLSLDYLTERNWPDLNDLLDAFFTEPAKRIVESVKLPS